ncbi:MAG TPA: Zn-dependent hydrolase, partial [Galbitalea sp.]
VAWTPEWLEARSWLRAKLAEIGLPAQQDPAGNLWAAIEGERQPFLIVGSHIDAVPGGGWLDGALGLLTALETMRQLTRRTAKPPLGVRFVDWADEEGARFGRSLLGSSACAGTLDPDNVRGLVDARGIRLVDALASCDVDLDAAALATERLEGACAYLELHIEQGPILLDRKDLASPVSGTFGVERHLVNFVGQAAHAGSTPMPRRQDSLTAAARAALEIRDSAIAHGGVATVGQIKSTPGVITAVAGLTEMQLDQRHLDPQALTAMLAEAHEICQRAAEEFCCTSTVRHVLSVAPTRFDEALVRLAGESVAQATGHGAAPIPSGPLHDATEIGRVVPTAMIFVQSDPPISHAEIEDSPQAALEVAIGAYGRTVGELLVRADQLASAGAAEANELRCRSPDQPLGRARDRTRTTG